MRVRLFVSLTAGQAVGSLRGPMTREISKTLLGLTVLAALGCGRPEPQVIRSRGPGPVRLIDELALAEIDSPLQTIRPWKTISSELEEEVVWELPLDSRGVREVCRVGSGGVIHCGEKDPDFTFRFRVPVETYRLYRVELDARGETSLCANLRLSDSRELRVRRFPEGRGEWHRLSELWFSAASDTLTLTLRGHCPLTIGSLDVRRTLLGRDEELAWLAIQAKGLAGDDLGMAKFGSLLPRTDAQTVEPPFDENFGFREALFAPAPTDLTYRLQVPRAARLRFAYAMAEASRPGDQARFEVLVRGAGVSEGSLWTRDLTAAPSSWYWHEAVVDLGAFQGQIVDLTLRTRSSGERGYSLWATPTVETPRRPNEPPNVIVLAVDTLRADRLSSYGYRRIRTPNLDALARDGALFSHAISQSVQTQPAFGSLFTGHIVPRHGLLFADSALAPAVPTLARVLRENGWTTHGIMYQAALYDAYSMARGFERYFNVPRLYHRADQNLAKALEWLEHNGDRRFFLFLHFLDPHQPFTQPDEFVEGATAKALSEVGVQIPFNLRGSVGDCEPCAAEGGVPESFRTVVNDLYDEEVVYVDDQIGRFLDALAERGLYDDTIIAFVSDHGETLWDHHDFFDHGGVNQHDELTRVPLVIKPAKGRGFASGSVITTQVRSFDMMPTLMEMVGIAPSRLELDAQSLVPLLRGGPPTDEGDRWAFSSNEQAASVRGNGWKYIHALSLGEELYHLADDPLETRNVVNRYPEVLSAMRARYMETLIESLGGRFLIVVGSGEASRYRVRVQAATEGSGASDRMVHLGIPLASFEEPGVGVFFGRAPLGRLVLFRRLRWSSQTPEVTVDSLGSDGHTDPTTTAPRPIPFEKGLAERLLVSGAPGAYLLDAPLKSTVAAEADAARLDADQEETLKALGYIE